MPPVAIVPRPPRLRGMLCAVSPPVLCPGVDTHAPTAAGSFGARKSAATTDARVAITWQLLVVGAPPPPPSRCDCSSPRTPTVPPPTDAQLSHHTHRGKKDKTCVPYEDGSPMTRHEFGATSRRVRT